MSQYYDLEKASQVLNLSTAEVNRLREQGKIQGFRDGSNWKFKREDVDKYLTQRIKSGSESGEFVMPADDDDLSLFEKDEDEVSSAEDNFLDLTFDDTELPSLLDEITPSKSAPATPSAQSKSGIVLDKGAEDFLQDDDDKIDIVNDLDILSLVDDDLSLDLGNSDGLSLASDDEVVLGGKKKEPAPKTSVNVDESSALSLAPEDSGFLLDLEDQSSDKVNLAKEGDAQATLDKVNLAKEGDTQATSSVSDAGSVETDDVYTLSDDDAESYTLAADDSPSYDLAVEPAEVASPKNESDSESSFSLADDEPAAEPQPVTSSSEIDLGGDDDDDGIFQLADEPVVPTATAPAPTAAPAPVAEADSDEDFRLDPITASADESDSESASQVIAVDDDNLFLPEDEPGSVFANVDTQSTDEVSASSDSFDPMNAGGFSEPLPGDGFGDPLPAPTGAGAGMPNETVGELDFDDSLGTPTMSVVATEGCSYNAGKGCAREAKYSGWSVLFLSACLIVLIPSAMAVFELIRVIWSWGEPFSLSGTILETVGNLFSLINK